MLQVPLSSINRNLFINPINCYFKQRLFPAEIGIVIVRIREGRIHINFISGMSADELFFEIIDIAARADDKVCSLSLGASAFEFDAVHGTDIVDIYGIAVFDRQGSVG